MFSTLFLLPLAAGTPFVPNTHLAYRQSLPDQYNLVNGNISSTVADVVALNKTLNGYGYNVTDIGFGLIATYGGANKVATDLNNTVISAQGSSLFSSSESQNVYLSLAGLLQPTFELLNNFVAHCNTYTNINVKSIVVSTLQKQRALVQQEGDALAAKVQSPFPQSIAFGAGLILGRFDSAISIFQQSSCPPPGSTAFNGGGSGNGSGGGAGGGATSTITQIVTTGGATVTQPASTITLPVSTVTQPGSTVTLPASTVTKPASTVTQPGGTITLPPSTVTQTFTTGGATVIQPGSTVTLSASTITQPSGTVTLPGSTVTLAGSTITQSGTTVTLPGSTVTKPGSTVTQPGSTVTLPGSTVTQPGRTITQPGSTVSIPGGTVTLPGSTVTKTITNSAATVTQPASTITKTEISTAPPSTVTDTVTKTDLTCSTTTSAGICFFWQPCWQTKFGTLFAKPTSNP